MSGTPSTLPPSRSTLSKNFCAWERICTAVFVLMCSVMGVCQSSAADDPQHTLYSAPLPAVESQTLQEAVVFIICPALALLGDGVWLADLWHDDGMHSHIPPSKSKDFARQGRMWDIKTFCGALVGKYARATWTAHGAHHRKYHAPWPACAYC